MGSQKHEHVLHVLSAIAKIAREIAQGAVW